MAHLAKNTKQAKKINPIKVLIPRGKDSKFIDVKPKSRYTSGIKEPKDKNQLYGIRLAIGASDIPVASETLINIKTL